MRTQLLGSKIKSLNLDDETKNAILAIIDLKTESEMEKVIDRLDASLNSFKGDIQSSKSEMNTSFNSFKWFIGVLVLVVSLATLSVVLFTFLKG